MKYSKNNPLFTASFLPKGNGKLLDYDDDKTGIKYRYVQFNTRPVIDCPFRSAGCESVCYATKGNHQFPSVKDSRFRSYEVSKADNFSERIEYTVRYHMSTKRYKGNVMIVRIHESGDFYSLQYLRKWVATWKSFRNDSGIVFVLYTKSFPFFLMLTEEEKDVIRSMMESGKLAINLSLDDTTTKRQRLAYLEMLKEFPLCNTYYCTENTDTVEHDDVCDCADCAKCGTCNKGTGKKTVVKIHSASKADMEEYRKNAER